MSTRRYIGARYVPEFYVNSVDGTELWESNVSYEPLTWVTLPNQHMYLSRKTVPDEIGSPADNPEYWLEVGQFNGYIDNLQTQIDAISESISDLPNIRTDVADIRNDVDELIASNERVYFCLGDSYTAGSGAETNYWSEAGSALGVDSSHWLSDAVVGLGLGDGSWLSEIQDYVSAHADLVPTITDFFIMGGFNDAGYTASALTTAFNTLITYIKNQFTGIKNIYVCCFGWSSGSNTIRMGISNNVRAAYRAMVNSQGAIYIDGLENVFHNYTFFNSDNVHPTTSAQRYAGKLLADYIKTGSCTPYAPRVTFNCSWTGMLPASDALFMRQIGNNIVIECDYTVTWTSYTTISGLTAVATINDRTGYALGTGYTEVPVSINNTPCKLVLSNQTIFLRCPSGFSIANAGTFTMSGVTSIPCDMC